MTAIHYKHREGPGEVVSPQPKPSRWARASRADLETLAEAADAHVRAGIDSSAALLGAVDALRASCPPLRTEAEVAAEALRLLRELELDARMSVFDFDRLRALAKEPTRG